MHGSLNYLEEHIRSLSYLLIDILLEEYQATITDSADSIGADSWEQFWKKVAPVRMQPRFQERSSTYTTKQPFQGLSSSTAQKIQKCLKVSRSHVQMDMHSLILEAEDKAPQTFGGDNERDFFCGHVDIFRDNSSCEYDLGFEYEGSEMRTAQT